MFDVVELTHLVRGLEVTDGASIRGVAGQDLELMQFTGLRDKSGVEIYEGDIVRWSDSFEERVFCYDLSIIWARGAWYLDTDESRKYPGSDVLFEIVWDEPQNVEVIGNIYENPELLDKEKVRAEADGIASQSTNPISQSVGE